MIVFGSKSVQKKLGAIAVPCPLRGRICRFEAWDIRNAFHIWFIPLGIGKHRHYEIRDKSVGIFYLAEYDLVQHAEKRPHDDSINELIAATNPEAIEAQRRHDDWVARCLESPRQSDDRLTYSVQMFADAEFSFQQATATGASESISAVLALFLICSVFAAAILWQSSASVWLPLPVATAAVLLPILVWRALVSSKKAGLRAIESQLADAIGRISPTLEEVDTARLCACDAGLQLAKAAETVDLWALIEMPGASMGRLAARRAPR